MAKLRCTNCGCIFDKELEILKDVIQIAKYLLWYEPKGKKYAERIIDEIHDGKYGSNEGIWTQADNAIKILRDREDLNGKKTT